MSLFQPFDTHFWLNFFIKFDLSYKIQIFWTLVCSELRPTSYSTVTCLGRFSGMVIGYKFSVFWKSILGLRLTHPHAVWNFRRPIFQKNRLFSFVSHECGHACMEFFEGLLKWLRSSFVRMAFELIWAEILPPVKIGPMLLRESIENFLTMQSIILNALFDVARLQLQPGHNDISICRVQKSLRHTDGRTQKMIIS